MRRAVALAFVLAGFAGVPAQADPDPVAAAMAKYHDSIVASGELLYWIGACEPFVPNETVTFYLREYAASGDGSTANFLLNRISRVHLDAYLSGRADRDAKPADAATCKRMVESAATDLAAAQKAEGSYR